MHEKIMYKANSKSKLTMILSMKQHEVNSAVLRIFILNSFLFFFCLANTIKGKELCKKFKLVSRG
jgi:hypothetical protein